MIDPEDLEQLADLECDECGHELYGGTFEFREFVDTIKQDGWKIRKDESGEWTHTCPECQR